MEHGPEQPLASRVTEETRSAEWVRQEIRLETEPGLELHGTLLVPRGGGRKPGVLVVETDATLSALAQSAARRGAVVLALAPRGLPRTDDQRPFGGEFVRTRARSWWAATFPALRAYDIRRGIDFLAARAGRERGSAARRRARRSRGVAADGGGRRSPHPTNLAGSDAVQPPRRAR